MKKILFIGFFVLIIIFSSNAQNDTTRVLFLGNSYTGVNNLPQLTSNLTSGTNKTLIYATNTPGGYTIKQHYTNTTTLNKIMQGNWDFVILQEQSQIPTIDYYRYNSMYPSTIKLNDTIKKYNPCATVLMYMTWGRKNGGQQCDGNGTHCSPVFVNFSHMQDSLESAYTNIADSINAYVSPVGIAWKKVIEDTNIVLHSSDNSHPNFAGSYLAACVFHSIFWNESPVGITYKGSLSQQLATYLQQVADSTVFHSYSDWNRNIDKVTAKFSYTIFSDSVQFTNISQSLFPASYYWDFGDGDTSTASNPYHVYKDNGSYQVSLVVSNCSKQDTIIRKVKIDNITDINDNQFKKSFKIFPNPSNNRLFLHMLNLQNEDQLVGIDNQFCNY